MSTGPYPRQLNFPFWAIVAKFWSWRRWFGENEFGSISRGCEEVGEEPNFRKYINSAVVVNGELGRKSIDSQKRIQILWARKSKGDSRSLLSKYLKRLVFKGESLFFLLLAESVGSG